MHLVRMAYGSRRRYCCSCGSRWVGSVKIFSPWARLAGALLLLAPAALTLVYLKKEGWFEPQPNIYRTANGEDPRTGTRYRYPARMGMEAMMEGYAAGAGRDPGWRGQFAGSNYTGQGRMPIRWNKGQMTELISAYRMGLRGAGPQNGQSQGMQEMLRQVTDAIKSTGKNPAQLADEIDQSDKQTLWDKYGNNFSSKDEAKEAYDEFKSHRSEIPADLPASPVLPPPSPQSR
jgi:hypothetical protein